MTPDVRIQRVLAPNAGYMTGTGTNTYVIDDAAGTVVIVDPGPTDSSHLDAIQRAAEQCGRIAGILVTHSHSDHLPGAFPLAQRTGAPILGHTRLGADQSLRDGEVWRVGGLEITALDTPGHTDDSLCYWLAPSHSLFTGDVVAGAATVIVDDQPGRLALYMKSLGRLQTLGEFTLYPGHGPRIDDGAAKIAEYSAHRRMREEQVLEALSREPALTVDRLVSQLYPDVARPLVPMAARNVRAHLDKLKDEGRVVQTGGLWRSAA